MNQTTLLCPNCHIKLETHTYDLHAVESCPRCSGLLIDSSELHEHVQLVTKEDTVVAAREVSAPEVIRPFLLSSKRACPRDGTKLRYINYGYDSNVLLEECLACRALWVENKQILPLAQYLKARPELLNLGEKMDKMIRHQDLHETVIRDPRVNFTFTLTNFPFPIADTTHALTFPWIMISLIVLQVILYGIEVLLSSGSNAFILQVALIPDNILNFQRWYTLVTHQLFHADLIHLVGNLFTLWIFGDNVESRMGAKLFLAFYIFAGIFAGLLASLLSLDPSFPMIGASGAIAGILGSYIMLYPKEKVRILFLNSIWGITAWKYLLFWVILQMIGFINERVAGEVSSISFIAHIAGFVFGLGVTWIFKKSKFLVREVNFYDNTYFKQD